MNLSASFYDQLETCLIALIESKTTRSRNNGRHHMRAKEIDAWRSSGVYLPGEDREVFGCDEGETQGFYDTQNDPVLSHGVVALPNPTNNGAEYKKSYCYFTGFKTVNTLPKPFKRMSGGLLYQLADIGAHDNGIFGENSYFTMTKEGVIYPCDIHLQSACQITRHQLITLYKHDPEIAEQRAFRASVAMQYIADRRFCWTITAIQDGVKIVLGSNLEMIKTLFMPRKGPLTDTARKRPIVHFVRDHVRRLKSGNDVEVSPHYRGIKRVELYGTTFVIKPPEVDFKVASVG